MKDVNEEDVNECYDPQLLTIVLQKYMAYLPLWSGILCPTNKRFSNAVVENWNSVIKNTIMSGQRQIKPSRVIRKCREYVLGIFKEMTSQIPINRLNYDRRNENSMLSEEV